MSEKSNKAFDRLIQEQFREFKVEPPAGLWSKISARLDQQPKKRLPYAWLAAAAVLIFAAFGLWLTDSPVNTVDLTKEQRLVQQPVPSALPKEVPENTTLRASLPETANKPQIVSHSALKPEISKTAAGRLAAEVQSKPVTSTVDVSVTSPEPTLIADPFPNSLDAASSPVNAANVEEESQLATQEEPVLRQRGGIGRFVNKLVSKVDSREDKLIEVSEEAGEGLRITGLNLGLVKMKNKYSK